MKSKTPKFSPALFALFALCAFFVCFAQSSWANVVITGTRVIYPAEQKNVIVKLENSGKNAALIQAWIDDGDANADPKKTKVPFVITPPVARVEANSGQSLRITFTGTQALATDRESLFYFNLLDIPPKPSKEFLEKSPNFLQFAVRSRLKLFYRPANLPLTPTDAYKVVKWKAVPNGVLVENNTPYYMNYVGLEMGKVGAKHVKMVAPFSQETFELKGAERGKTITWYLVNDYGGDSVGEAVLE